jgi:hypothetical protein
MSSATEERDLEADDGVLGFRQLQLEQPEQPEPQWAAYLDDDSHLGRDTAAASTT